MKRYQAIILYVLFFLIMTATISMKKNYHIDEMLSYGLSNNRGNIKMEIVDGEKYNPTVLYADYLTADENDRFSYDIVWENQENDVHPPLYYAILHTICSLFPGVFSRYFAGIINIVFALATLYMIRKIIPFFVENKIYKELLSVAFILSAGILSAVSFFRMYIMAMCWVTVLVYLYIREVERKQFRTQFFVATYVVTLLGALTHYYCIVFAVLISIVYSIYLLVHKMWKKVIAFCVSMGAAGLSAYLIFPAMIKHMFSGYRGKEAIASLGNLGDFWDSTKAYFDILNNQMFGGILGCVLMALVFYSLFVIMKRNMRQIECFSDCDNKIVQKYELVRYSLIGIPAIMYFLIVSKMAPYQTDRYMMPIYAIAFVGLFCLIIRIVEPHLTKSGVIIFVCIILGIVTVGSWSNIQWSYLYTNSQTFLEKTANYNDVECICVYQGSWQIPSQFLEAQQYQSITFVSKENQEMIDDLEANYKDSKLVLMVVGDADDDKYISEFLEKSEVMNKSKYIGGFAYGKSYYLYE